MEQREAFIDLAEPELESIEDFRSRTNTAVLTVMFTDIEGFTRLTDEKGEQHSNRLRQRHDEVLDATITDGGAGIVVKHVGDAILAVFSEPSAAVERALLIQRRLEELNRESPDLGGLKVRIGLDMGQVTVEDSVNLDVFGRHVNRASRVEALAAGGQVYMTYTVFDSARGWLADPDNEGRIWTSHGRYHLKGVSAPVEIFQVANSGHDELRAPRHGKKARSVPGLVASLALVMVGLGLAIALGRFKSTDVWLVQYAPPLSYVDGGAELLLDADDGQAERRVLLDLGPGRHILHYDVADGVRYYAAIAVERGENYIQPEFAESRLPSLYRFRAVTGDPIQQTRAGQYFFHDGDGNRIDRSAEISVSLSTIEGQEGDLHRLGWTLDVDGERVAERDVSLAPRSPGEPELEEEDVVYGDAYHFFSVHTRIFGEYAHLEVRSAFGVASVPR